MHYSFDNKGNQLHGIHNQWSEMAGHCNGGKCFGTTNGNGYKRITC